MLSRHQKILKLKSFLILFFVLSCTAFVNTMYIIDLKGFLGANNQTLQNTLTVSSYVKTSVNSLRVSLHRPCFKSNLNSINILYQLPGG